jgi:hypothetical protein
MPRFLSRIAFQANKKIMFFCGNRITVAVATINAFFPILHNGIIENEKDFSGDEEKVIDVCA